MQLVCAGAGAGSGAIYYAVAAQLGFPLRKLVVFVVQETTEYQLTN